MGPWNPPRGIGNDMFENLKVFYAEARSEYRKISWPSKAEVQGSTTVVLATVGLCLVALFLFDSIITYLMTIVIK